MNERLFVRLQEDPTHGPESSAPAHALRSHTVPACCYLADLAVVKEAQGLHIGQALLHAVRARLGPQVALILSSVPEAVSFYERAGMERIADAFWYRRGS